MATHLAGKSVLICAIPCSLHDVDAKLAYSPLPALAPIRRRSVAKNGENPFYKFDFYAAVYVDVPDYQESAPKPAPWSA